MRNEKKMKIFSFSKTLFLEEKKEFLSTNQTPLKFEKQCLKKHCFLPKKQHFWAQQMHPNFYLGCVCKFPIFKRHFLRTLFFCRKKAFLQSTVFLILDFSKCLLQT